MKPRKNYTTHISTLLVALKATTGPVIELGGGQSSTPFLHWVAKAGGRKLITYENDPTYYHYCRGFRSKDHRVVKVEDWDAVPIDECGVVFVDLHPSNMRHVMANKFKDAAQIVVIHDTERDDNNYQNSAIWPNFKYRFDYMEANPYTSMVSNYIDVSQFKNHYKAIC